MSDLFTEVPECWICKGTVFKPRFSALLSLQPFEQVHAYNGQRVSIQQCQKCGFMQPKALPSQPDYFDVIYHQKWSEEWMESDFSSIYKDFIFKSILRHLDYETAREQNRNILDVGAHIGKFAYLAKEAGWEVDGIELNPICAEFAARRTGVSIIRKNAHELAESSEHKYTCVTLTDVLEHIPQPLNALRSIFRLIKPKGWIAVKVPCAPSQIFKQRIRSWISGPAHMDYIAMNLVHISHFNVQSLRTALENAGFSNIQITVGAPELSDHRAKASEKITRDLFRLGVYRLAQLPFAVHTPLAMNLQAYAQKLA